jgi:hypothetical protein
MRSAIPEIAIARRTEPVVILYVKRRGGHATSRSVHRTILSRTDHAT